MLATKEAKPTGNSLMWVRWVQAQEIAIFAISFKPLSPSRAATSN